MSVQLVKLGPSNASPLWRFAEPLPEPLELADDREIVDWARRQWDDLAVLILLPQEDGPTGVVPLDCEGRVLNSRSE